MLRKALDKSPHITGSEVGIVAPDWHAGPDLESFIEAVRQNATVRGAIERLGFHYPRTDLSKKGPLFTNLTADTG
jgi:hypothetical protein